MTDNPFEDDEPAEAPEVEVRLHPILSNEEFRAAQAKARASVEKERKAAAMAMVEKQETERLRVVEGLTTGIGGMDDMVSITIDLPRYSPGLRVNGPMGMYYEHSKTYPVPRHVANSLNEMMGRAWRHEDQVDGKDIGQMYHRKLDSRIDGITGAVKNAPVMHG